MGLRDFAQSLKQETTKMIKEAIQTKRDEALPLVVNRKQSYVSNPERPWILAGGTALVVGVLGAVFSWGAWSYVVGGAGVVTILYGQTKKKPQDRTEVVRTRESVSEPKGYEVAEKVIEISKMVEDKWRTKVEECKVMVQKAIEMSSASIELKDSLMGKTYTTERVSIDFDIVVSRLESQIPGTYPSLLSDYERIVNGSIDKAAEEQIAIYRNISQKL